MIVLIANAAITRMNMTTIDILTSMTSVTTRASYVPCVASGNVQGTAADCANNRLQDQWLYLEGLGDVVT